METTISTAEIISMVKQAVIWLAGLGIVVDLTPGIKVQPVRWLIKQLGNLLNHDIKVQLDNLQSGFTTHQIESWRYEILDFANSCMNHRKHTKEEFDHIIKVHDDYEEYIQTHKIENGQVKIAYAYIEKIYAKCLERNSFLSGRPDEE